MRLAATGTAAAILVTLVGVAAGVCGTPGEIVLWGDDTEKPVTNAANYQPTSAEIKIDSAVLFEIHTRAAGYSIAEREAIILQRLAEALSTGKITPVRIGAIRGRPTIYIDRVRLVTIYPEDVAAVKAQSDWSLAQQWAAGVQKVLQQTAPDWCFAGPEVYTVAIGGKVLFRLADPTGYATIRERGRAVDGQVAGIVGEYDPALVTLAPVPTGVAVMFKGQPVVIATDQDARARGLKSAQVLAAAWARNLQQVMALVKNGAVTAAAGAPATAPAPPPPPAAPANY